MLGWYMENSLTTALSMRAAMKCSLHLALNPMGIILYDAERMIVVVCDGRRTMPDGATERSFISYAGAYKFDGEKLVVRVDGASSPAGFADQVRQISFREPNRYVATLVDGNSVRRDLTWERIGLPQFKLRHYRRLDDPGRLTAPAFTLSARARTTLRPPRSPRAWACRSSRNVGCYAKDHAAKKQIQGGMGTRIAIDATVAYQRSPFGRDDKTQITGL